MSEQIKDLIEKIQQEGVIAAEAKARAIEAEAKSQAEEIIQKAKSHAQELIKTAQVNSAKIEQNTQALLVQAGRDLLLNLKKEINSILQRLIIKEIQNTLTPEELARIIITLIKASEEKQSGEVIVSLSKADCERLERDFLGKLSENLKSGIVLRPSEDISAGFTISYDAGRSFFDFSDKALAEYISLYLKPKLAEILKD